MQRTCGQTETTGGVEKEILYPAIDYNIVAKIVCKKCGHKNPASAVSCSNCGSFLVPETGVNISADSTVATAPTFPKFRVSEQEPAQSSSQSGSTTEAIEVMSSNSAQTLALLIALVVFVIFIYFEYTISLPWYYFYFFLVLIFLIPTVLRRSASGVRFTNTGFYFPKSTSQEIFPYGSISYLRIGDYDRVQQSLTLNFNEQRPPVRVEFRSMSMFRLFLGMMNRRRILILNKDQPAPGETGQEN